MGSWPTLEQSQVTGPLACHVPGRWGSEPHRLGSQGQGASLRVTTESRTQPAAAPAGPCSGGPRLQDPQPLFVVFRPGTPSGFDSGGLRLASEVKRVPAQIEFLNRFQPRRIPVLPHTPRRLFPGSPWSLQAGINHSRLLGRAGTCPLHESDCWIRQLCRLLMWRVGSEAWPPPAPLSLGCSSGWVVSAYAAVPCMPPEKGKEALYLNVEEPAGIPGRRRSH